VGRLDAEHASSARCRVEQHSIVFVEPLPRMLRSLYPIGGVVFEGDRAPMTGAEVRDYHIPIKGVDSQGRRYSALNPDVFYWAHATVFMGTVLTAEHFGDGLTEDQKRQLFDEHVTWYRMYGMSMRPVPASWADFQVYWDHMCRNVLENNWATRQVLDLPTMPKHPSLQWIPDATCLPSGSATTEFTTRAGRARLATRRRHSRLMHKRRRVFVDCSAQQPQHHRLRSLPAQSSRTGFVACTPNCSSPGSAAARKGSERALLTDLLT
jgi:uncharacterized protein (DUF2236 family)